MFTLDEETKKKLDKIKEEEHKYTVYELGTIDAEALSEAGAYSEGSGIELANGDSLNVQFEFAVGEKTTEQVKTEITKQQKVTQEAIAAKLRELEMKQSHIDEMVKAIKTSEMTFDDFMRQKSARGRFVSWMRKRIRRKRRIKTESPWIYMKDSAKFKEYSSTKAIDLDKAKTDDELSGAASIIDEELKRRQAKEQLENSFKEWCETVMRSLHVIENQIEVLQQIEDQMALIEVPEGLEEFMSQVKLMLAKAKQHVLITNS
jgi:hypothetical protein